MVGSRTRWLAGLLVGQLVLLAVTFPFGALGTQTWHHLASLGLVLAVAGLLHERFTSSRRFLALGVMTFSVLASASGFYLLYWKAGIRVDEYQDWAVFWHIAWSWAAAVFFVQHAWINRVQLVHFYRESLATPLKKGLHVGAYLVLVAAIVATWSPEGRLLFTNENYVPLSLRIWALATIPPYLAWLYLRRRERRDAGWTKGTFGHWGIRRVVDLVLVPAAALSILSGFPLLFDDLFAIDARGLKYASKTWHVWPSIVFSVLAFIHGNQAWTSVKAHWRAYRE